MQRARSWCALLSLIVASPLAAQGMLAMYCSSPSTAWCQGMAIGMIWKSAA